MIGGLVTVRMGNYIPLFYVHVIDYPCPKADTDLKDVPVSNYAFSDPICNKHCFCMTMMPIILDLVSK